MPIYFHDEKINSGLKRKLEIKSWLNSVLASENKRADKISIILTSDENLREINKKYLSKNYYTDIITFDYSNESSISGDLFISLERVEENAEKYGTEKNRELLRVIVHGILHLMGYGDANEDEKRNMRNMEDRFLENSPT